MSSSTLVEASSDAIEAKFPPDQVCIQLQTNRRYLLTRTARIAAGPQHSAASGEPYQGGSRKASTNATGGASFDNATMSTNA